MLEWVLKPNPGGWQFGIFANKCNKKLNVIYSSEGILEIMWNKDKDHLKA